MASLGHPSKFQPVSRLGFVTAPTLLNGGQQNFAGCLAVSWVSTLYIHLYGLYLFEGIDDDDNDDNFNDITRFRTIVEHTHQNVL